jgi:hypothetical protein
MKALSATHDATVQMIDTSIVRLHNTLHRSRQEDSPWAAREAV